VTEPVEVLAGAAFYAGRLELDMKMYRAEFIGRPVRVSAYQESACEEHAKTTRKKSAYTISILMQARAVMVRRVSFWFVPVHHDARRGSAQLRRHSSRKQLLKQFRVSFYSYIESILPI
jgi:hypothetical protein